MQREIDVAALDNFEHLVELLNRQGGQMDRLRRTVKTREQQLCAMKKDNDRMADTLTIQAAASRQLEKTAASTKEQLQKVELAKVNSNSL